MANERPVVGWIGLGAMGSGMASNLVSQGFVVKAYDTWQPSLDKVVEAGAQRASSPREAATGVQVLGLMVVNAQQVEDVLFGQAQVAEVLEHGASIICFSTVPPSFQVTIQQRLDALGKGIRLCDSPVSGGSTRAATGELTIMTSGTPISISTAKPVLEALTQAPVGGLSVVGDKVGTASDFKLINQVFCAVQIAAQGEAMAFAANLGLNPRLVYNIVRTASGDSFMFGHRVPWSLRPDGIPKSAMSIITKDIGIVMDEARSLNFPAPMCAVTEQVFSAGIGAGLVKEDDGLISKLWEKLGGVALAEQGSAEEEEERAKELSISMTKFKGKVLFVGLGAMGLPMAITLTKANISVVGFDVNPQAGAKFSEAGGEITEELVEAATQADTVVLVVNTAKQAEEILFGSANSSGIAASLPKESTIVICSTIAASDAIRLQGALDKLERGIQLVDAPVSGGPTRAAKGDLAIMASGSEAALAKVSGLLRALSTVAGKSSNLHYIPGGVGSGSKMKIVNNLLAAIHLAITAEGLAFARYKGMDLNKVFDVISRGAASSYMLHDRTPRIFQREEAAVHSATSTLLKDLSICLAEAKKCNTPLFLGQAATQRFTEACARGWAREDDSSLGRLWEDIGINLKL